PASPHLWPNAARTDPGQVRTTWDHGRMTASRRRPMDGYDAATYGERFADVYDDWYGDLTDTEACVAAVADLARSSAGEHTPAVLELGVGTGRIAVPLATTG